MIGKHAGATALTCALAVAMTGCATIFSGANQTVTIYSNPPGAFVKVGRQTGMTPLTLTLPKGGNYSVEVMHAPGNYVVPLERKLDPATLLNVVPPFWPGFLVDAWTGAMTKYDPNVLTVDFKTATVSDSAQLTGFSR